MNCDKLNKVLSDLSYSYTAPTALGINIEQIRANVFYSTFLNVFILSTFVTFFNVFYFSRTFFTSMEKSEDFHFTRVQVLAFPITTGCATVKL